MEWPDGDIFDTVREDLSPLDATYHGILSLPDGLEELEGGPLVRGSINALPWEYRGTASTRQRGEVDPAGDRPVTIRGVTIVHETAAGVVFRRYVDWAGVWAQLGRSTGRGEQVVDQDFINPFGVRIDPDTFERLG